MSFFTIVETLLIGPLKLVFEVIFEIANRKIGHPGLAIVVLSLIMNILVLPLYKRADAMQEEARDVEKKLHDGVAHIKKTFAGDERMMILQAYYRQNNYQPTSVLKGSVSLLLEIPFFMAAYQFLSNVESLNGVSFGPIVDLGAPDGLLVIGGLTLNLLPILMTLINVVSSAIYLKGFPLKTKIQLYGMALFFLVFLYESPSCLVFYWTLNNVFSLCKNIVYKIKNIVSLPKPQKETVRKEQKWEPNQKMFILGALFLTVLVGLLIPSTFIAASPQEYVDISYFYNPLWYVVNAVTMAAGTFLVWMRVFYGLANPFGKTVFEKLVWIMCGVMLMNYMFFGTDLGILTPNLQYEEGFFFSSSEKMTNLLAVAAAAVLLYIVIKKWNRAVSMVLLTAVIALGGMSAWNIAAIKDSVDELAAYQTLQDEELPSFRLSKNGKNVVVIMLDRAMNEYVPYLFNEKPELKEKFAGFTHYSNTISFGGYTNFATPGLFGGYEYTPVEMNKRSSESLVTKHNEAIKMMPVLFLENDYEVTVCDPVYANYQKIPDLTVFDDYPEIRTFITKGVFSGKEQKEVKIQYNRRNFFCFSVMKTMPLICQPTIYNKGLYNNSGFVEDEEIYTSQAVTGISEASGISELFMEPYNVLYNLPFVTEIMEDDTDTFMYLTNDTTHEPMLLQMPDYVPAKRVDNKEYDEKHADRFTLDGKTIRMENPRQLSHYQANMAAYDQLAKWFDYLRENDVYDNTRIILVADHGKDLAHFDELIVEDGTIDLEFYYPMMMVKDFDSQEFTVSDEFMTNADVPTLATKDIIENPRNPFTGNPINSDEKTAHDQFIILSDEWEVSENNGDTYFPAKWASVKEDLWDLDNWKFYDEEIVLTEHELDGKQ